MCVSCKFRTWYHVSYKNTPSGYLNSLDFIGYCTEKTWMYKFILELNEPNVIKIQVWVAVL